MSRLVFANCGINLSMRLAVAVILVIWGGTYFGNGETVLAQSEAVAASEYDLKLSFIYLTAKFTTWSDEPPSSDAPFVIGVIDPDPFQGGLTTLQRRTLKKQKRPIRVVIIKKEADYQPCHLLFIPREAKPEFVDSMLKRTANQPVLVWRDEVDPNKAAGVACSFVRNGNEFLIEVDPAEFARRKLVPDGQLLNLKLVRTVKSSK